jgi:hypothetical protein
LGAVWNKAAVGVVEATRQVEAALPFELLGFDCDNRSEFLNWHLVRHFQERCRPVGFTRSRPYHKDDNGHVEQKNWTHVRQLLGYGRLEDPELCAQITRLYVEYWEPLHNYFCPSAKLVTKERHGAKVQRRHDVPTTPCDRLLACAQVDRASKDRLEQERARLNPFDLARNVERALRRVLQRSLRSSRPTGSSHSGNANGNKTAITSVS